MLDPSQCVAIEDSRNGLDAALACGIATLITPSIYSKLQLFPGAARILASLDDEDRPVDIAALEAMLGRRTEDQAVHPHETA
jgi:beta-phosphoglucomutase-like phosphatase (HAD superfamily)